MTPAQPAAERPAAARGDAEPGRAHSQRPGRAGEQRESAGTCHRCPGQQQGRDHYYGGESPGQHCPHPGRGARAAAAVLPHLPGAPGDRPGRHHPGQPGGGEHQGGHGPPRQIRAAGGQQLALRPGTAGQRHDLRRNSHTQPPHARPAQVADRGPHIAGCAGGAGHGGRHHTHCQHPHPGPATAEGRPHPTARERRDPAGRDVPGPRRVKMARSSRSGSRPNAAGHHGSRRVVAGISRRARAEEPTQHPAVV